LHIVPASHTTSSGNWDDMQSAGVPRTHHFQVNCCRHEFATGFIATHDQQKQLAAIQAPRINLGQWVNVLYHVS